MRVGERNSVSYPRFFAHCVLLSCLAGCGAAADSTASTASAPPVSVPQDPLLPPGPTWVGAWGTAMHQSVNFSEVSLRMVVHPSIGGDQLRLRFSNAHGQTAAQYRKVSIALRDTGPAIDAATLSTVRFDGAESFELPPGGERISDPLVFSFAAGDDLAISFHVGTDAPLDQHGNAVAINYISASGDFTEETSGASYTSTSTSWMGLVGVDVQREGRAGTFVALGDSITDGGNPPDTNNRWPDYFATRLAAEGIDKGVLNAGIGANQVTRDTNFLGMSQAAVTRFARDVLARPSVDSLVLFEGTNDLNGGVLADEVYAGLRDMSQRARALGIHVIAGTVTPRGKDPLWGANPALEEQRQILNASIRAGIGTDFDALADFDTALASPGAPDVMNPLFDSGDGLHPNALGYQALADAVPLDFLQIR